MALCDIHFRFQDTEGMVEHRISQLLPRSGWDLMNLKYMGPYPHSGKHHQKEKETIWILSSIDCICLASLQPEKSCDMKDNQSIRLSDSQIQALCYAPSFEFPKIIDLAVETISCIGFLMSYNFKAPMLWHALASTQSPTNDLMQKHVTWDSPS